MFAPLLGTDHIDHPGTDFLENPAHVPGHAFSVRHTENDHCLLLEVKKFHQLLSILQGVPAAGATVQAKVSRAAVRPRTVTRPVR